MKKDAFTMRLKRRNYRSNNAGSILSVVQKAVRFCAAASDLTLNSRLEQVVISPTMLDFLRDLATLQFDLLVSDLIQPLSKLSGSSTSRFLNLLINHLLDEVDVQGKHIFNRLHAPTNFVNRYDRG